MKKPGVIGLLRVIGKLQDLIGRASSANANDRSPDRFLNTDNALREAFDLCIETRSQFPPVSDTKRRTLNG